VHDLTAARIWGIIGELAASGLVVLADIGATTAPATRCTDSGADRAQLDIIATVYRHRLGERVVTTPPEKGTDPSPGTSAT
jgi:hypothetical protein